MGEKQKEKMIELNGLYYRKTYPTITVVIDPKSGCKVGVVNNKYFHPEELDDEDRLMAKEAGLEIEEKNLFADEEIEIMYSMMDKIKKDYLKTI